MRFRSLAALLLLILTAAVAVAQLPPTLGRESPTKDHDTLPNGKSRKLEIIKQDHAKSLEDVAAILALAKDLEAELEKNTEHVVSMDAMRKAEEIESLSKRLQKRMKRLY